MSKFFKVIFKNYWLSIYILPTVSLFQHYIHLSFSNSTLKIHECINALGSSFNNCSTLKGKAFRWNLSKAHTIAFIVCNINGLSINLSLTQELQKK